MESSPSLLAIQQQLSECVISGQQLKARRSRVRHSKKLGIDTAASNRASVRAGPRSGRSAGLQSRRPSLQVTLEALGVGPMKDPLRSAGISPTLLHAPLSPDSPGTVIALAAAMAAVLGPTRSARARLSPSAFPRSPTARASRSPLHPTRQSLATRLMGFQSKGLVLFDDDDEDEEEDDEEYEDMEEEAHAMARMIDGGEGREEEEEVTTSDPELPHSPSSSSAYSASSSGSPIGGSFGEIESLTIDLAIIEASIPPIESHSPSPSHLESPSAISPPLVAPPIIVRVHMSEEMIISVTAPRTSSLPEFRERCRRKAIKCGLSPDILQGRMFRLIDGAALTPDTFTRMISKSYSVVTLEWM